MTKLLLLLSLIVSNLIPGKQSATQNRTFTDTIFCGIYSEHYRQPLALHYKCTNRKTVVSRKHLNFYTNDSIITSGHKDYTKNVWDKGHLAPAATFADSRENLVKTFSYLNCVLQHEKLNRGQWARLEAQERNWDNFENLNVSIYIHFSSKSLRLSSGAVVPDSFTKHIFFTKSHKWLCFGFANRPNQNHWANAQVICKSH